MAKTVIIDCFPESALHYRDNHAIVVIDVIRATTTATTAVSFGRRVFPVQTTDSAFILAEKIPDAILVGELGGNVPYGFHMTNSPVQVTALEKVPCGPFSDPRRPIILLSSSGTQLLFNAAGAKAVYLACFRNYSAVAGHIAERHHKIAILGAGTRGQFRREDQMGCAWVAEKLIASGFTAASTQTVEIVERWRGVLPAVVREGRSADYLRKSGQIVDLEFILHHIDDLDTVPVLRDGELVKVDE
jgi:2-phosphosulfolactate phosphatase